MSDTLVEPPIFGKPPPVPSLPKSVAARIIALLTGLAGFFTMLIGVVLLAHQLRPIVREHAPVDPANVLAAEIDTLTTSDDRQTRLEAASRLVTGGPEVFATALDTMTTLSDDGNVLSLSTVAVRALAAVGPDAARPLAVALGNPQVKVRAGAASVLREMGGNAAPAATALAGALDDENRWVRWYACESLGNLGSEGEVAVSELTGALEHPDRLTRRRAAAALGQIGPAASAAIDALKRAEREDAESDVRRAATLALYQINLEQIARQAAAHAPSDVARWMSALSAEGEHERVAAAHQLIGLGSRAEPAIPALAMALRAESKWVREAAAIAIGAMPRAARKVTPALRAATDDPEIEVRIAARRALEKIEAGR